MTYFYSFNRIEGALVFIDLSKKRFPCVSQVYDIP